MVVVGLKALLDIAVVRGVPGDLGILDGLCVDGEFVEDVACTLSIEASGRRASGVLDGERRRIGLVAWEETEEVGLAEAEHRPDVGALDFALEIPIQHVPYLVICKPLMHVSHIPEPSFWALGYGKREESPFKT